MAIAASLCLNLSSPTPTSKFPPLPPPSKTSQCSQTQVPSQRDEKWRGQCVAGMASVMIIGAIQMGNIEDMSAALAEDVMRLSVDNVAESESKAPRWSDKRTCPPWHLNSLETIVPENLPRPAARRRWEAVGFTKNAPVVEASVKSKSNCFSM